MPTTPSHDPAEPPEPSDRAEPSAPAEPALLPAAPPVLLHTWQLGPAGLAEIRELLDEVFEGDFSDEDFEHGLGGLHALVRDPGGRLVAHGAVVMRRVLHGGPAADGGHGGHSAGDGRSAGDGDGGGHSAGDGHGGRWYRVGYVENIGVLAALRRRGIGGSVLAALEEVVAGAYDFGALSASEEGEKLYRSRGWRPWGGRILGVGPGGLVRLPEEEGSVYVRGGIPAPEDALAFDWRDGDVL
ncbi:GNAT family N-acetyltransferase [Streptomyces sp. NPDC003691]